MKNHPFATPFLLVLLSVIVTSAVWAAVVMTVPPEPSSEMAGPGNLSNTDGLPCAIAFWDERANAIQALGVADEMLAYETTDDMTVEVCSNASRVGNLVTLTALRPNGWGQTTNWEVAELVNGRAVVTVPFTMTIGYGSTDSIPQCLFNNQVRDEDVPFDAYGIPTKVTVDCAEADLQGRGTSESFVIDFAAKTATRVEPIPEGASNASGAVSIAYVSPLYQPSQIPEGVPQLATADLSLYTDAASYHAPNYSQEGTLVVSHDATWDKARCDLPPTMETGKLAFDRTETFGGNTWNVMDVSDAGAGNRYDTTLYLTFANGVCYQVATTLHSASDWTDVDLDAIAASQKATRELLNAAARSVSLK